jgi:hypothetical protein
LRILTGTSESRGFRWCSRRAYQKHRGGLSFEFVLKSTEERLQLLGVVAFALDQFSFLCGECSKEQAGGDPNVVNRFMCETNTHTHTHTQHNTTQHNTTQHNTTHTRMYMDVDTNIERESERMQEWYQQHIGCALRRAAAQAKQRL